MASRLSRSTSTPCTGWTAEYVRLLEDGEAGAALMLLRRLRYDEPDVDPWDLVQLVAAGALVCAEIPVHPALVPDAGPPAAVAEGHPEAG